jgi:hypothetical protein
LRKVVDSIWVAVNALLVDYKTLCRCLLPASHQQAVFGSGWDHLQVESASRDLYEQGDIPDLWEVVS